MLAVIPGRTVRAQHGCPCPIVSASMDIHMDICEIHTDIGEIHTDIDISRHLLLDTNILRTVQ